MKMKTAEVICKEISDRILEYKDLQDEHGNNMDGWKELESAIHELEHLLEWANE